MELYEWQREAIGALVEGPRRVLVVAPTGGGKSMCYQQPAVELEGVALVITPLVALMADQVAALTARGVPATYLASNIEPAENERRAQQALAGEVKLLYIAPERLASSRFVDDVLARLPLSLLAVDEAHCISHWGHDFRPDYLQLGDLIERLRPPRLLACTATATPAVRREIVERLHMPEAHQVLRGFARDNLELSVEEVSGPKKKEERIAAEVKRVLGKPGGGAGSAIVYTSQRRHAEDVAIALRAHGWRADHYHAGMDGPSRNAVQDNFQSGTLDVIAATNAFGMGIDRADIRLIVHHAVTESVEAYYQEVGRAGRDGQPARGLLLMSDPDIAWRFRLIAGEVDLGPEQALRRREMLRSMIAYAESSSCRHDGILRYFEDEAEALGGCGHCDNCRAIAAGTMRDEPDEAASAETVKKALTGIRALPFAAGPGAIASFLIGNPSRQIAKYDWDKRADFGPLRERNEDWAKRLLRRLVAGGLLHIDPEHSTLHLTRRAADVIGGVRPNAVRLPPDASPTSASRRTSSNGAKMPSSGSLDGAASALFERLRAWREELAKKMDVPHYAILNDATLRAIAVARPQTDEELLSIPGIGPAKLERHGEDLRRIVGEHADGSVPAEFANGEGTGYRGQGTVNEATAATDAGAKSWHEERVAEARKLHPRAYEPWTDDEDERLRALAVDGATLDKMAQVLERQPNAVRIRSERLGVHVAGAEARAEVTAGG
jgi:ATP-dependent DNA helicase RecQ